MEISKTLSIQNPPYNSTDNYSLTFKLTPALTDMTASYVNIPVSIDEVFNSTNYPGNVPIGNVNIGNDLFMTGVSHTPALFIRNVNLTADGQDIVYTNFINTLATNLSVYLYNNAEARLMEFMATEEPTVNETLINASTRNHLYSSLYRELFNLGTTQSKKTSAFIRLPLKEILGQYATQIRDLTKYQEVLMTLELDPVGLQAHSNSDSYYPDNATAGKPNTRTQCIQNAHPLSDLGYSSPITGTATLTTTFTFDSTTLTLANFPIRVGDVVSFGATVGNNITITGVNVVNGIVVSLTAVGLTNGNGSIPINTIPLRGVFTVENTYQPAPVTQSSLNAKWLNKNISYILNNNNLLAFPNDFANVINTIQAGGVGGDTVFILDNGASANIPGTRANPGFLANNGLSINYAGNASIPAGNDITTSNNFNSVTFSFWVGQAVYITGSANVTPVYAKITSIQYSGGKAVFQLDTQVVVSGGNAAGVNLFTIHADSYEIKLEKKFELVQLKLNSMFAKQLQLSNKYEKWVYDGSIVLPLAQNSSYETTFLLEPLCKMCVICITKDNTLNSTKDTLSKYRILIDGMDTTNRDIDLNDESLKNERVISGFNSFYEDLHCVQTKTTNNPFSTDDNSYTIFQEIPVDGKDHKLTLILRNGDVLSTASNLRVYKLVLSQIN